jgi:predicted RecA/RadA family phage recombinase
MALNQKFNHGDQFTVPETVVDAPATVTSGAPVVLGQLPAVALTDPQTDSAGVDQVTVKTNGVYEFTVTGAAGAIAAGDLVYINTTTGALSNTNTGVRFGYALGAVANAASTPIDVKIGY